jgi:hypothetical protein
LVVVSPLGRSWAVEEAQEQVDRDTPISRTPTSTLVIGGFLHTQHIVKFGFSFMTLYQVFLQRRDLGLELFGFLYMVSNNTSTRGNRSFIVRATRQGK